jgi:hypothetical protein
VFAKKGGFDLILGNPPWLLVRWEENGIMGEANPIFDIMALKKALYVEQTFGKFCTLH